MGSVHLPVHLVGEWTSVKQKGGKKGIMYMKLPSKTNNVVMFDY